MSRYQTLSSGFAWVALGGVLLPSLAASGSEISGPDRSSSSFGPVAASAVVTKNLQNPEPVFSAGRIEALARSTAGLDSRIELLDRLENHPQAATNLIDSTYHVDPLALPASSLEIASNSAQGPKLGDSSSVGVSSVDILNQPVLVNSPIPEPTSVMLVLTGLVGLILRGHMRRSMAR
ncbi:MAG TPA: hypothetical protein VFT74_12690 [Isosphaeraceae bacterium]|nr:hypothetical protein [Isosphaeraceae bacterium]